STAARDVVAPATGPGILAAAPRLHFRPARMDLNRPLPLQLLKHPDGSALKEGDLLILQAGADDFDDVAGDKQPGRSPEVEIKIIGRTALEQILNQEQAKVQQEILRLREKQREAREKVAEVEKRLRKGDKLSADDLNNLLQAEQAQQQVREGVGSPKEGLRKEVNRILETLRQNRMEKSGTRDVMENVARELERIAGSELEQI